MKLLLFTLLSLVALTFQQTLRWPKSCMKQNDCDEDECCSIHFFIFGQCLPRPIEGERCKPPVLMGTFFSTCPCDHGLVCKKTIPLSIFPGKCAQRNGKPTDTKRSATPIQLSVEND